MSARKRFFFKLSIVAVVYLMVMVAISSVLIIGQPPSKRHVGLVDDWSFHHMVFSNPGTYQEAIANGTYSKWLRIQYDTRFILQQMKSNASGSSTSAVSASTPQTLSLLANPMVGGRGDAIAAKPNKGKGTGGLWTSSLLTGAVLPITYPAKYTFNPIGTPDCTNDYVVYPVGSAGAAATDASQTGTFSTSSGSGSVAVDGVTLTASPGTQATQSTTVNSNGFASGNTITITPPFGTTLNLIASAPVAEEYQFAVAFTAPSTGAYDRVGGASTTIEYEFEASGWTNSSVPSGTCYINEAAGRTGIVTDLTAAINYNGSTNGSNTTWYCGASSTQPSNGVTAAANGNNVDVTAKIAGSTGFPTPTSSGTNAPAPSSLVAASDGSSTAPNFQWWNGAAAISSATTLATHIFNAMAGNAAGITGGNPSAGVVTITATLSGLAGNSISVATTSTTADLSGAKFTGTLSGGTAGTTSGLTFATSTDLTTSEAANEAAEATNLASAINTNVGAVTATHSGAGVTVTDNTAGPGGNTIGTTGNVGGTFSWSGTTLAGGANPTANIIAYNNLYATTCNGTVPLVYWAYNTGTGYKVTTSPVLSYDGTKVAFIQTTSTAAQLVVLKFSASGGSVSSATSPTTSTNISGCTAPCMSVTTISGVTTGDTYSSPYYDYATDDALYVGDNASHLYKISGVFNSATAPTVASVTLNATAYSLSSPVYDSTSGCVFVGDSEGYLYSVASGNAGTVCVGSSFATFGHSELMGNGGANEGIFDGPLVDPAAQEVYAFITDSKLISNCAAGDNCVAQFTTGTISSGSTTAAPANEEPLGTGGANYNLYNGAFDNVYFSSAAGTAGDLWAMGNTGAAGGNLYRVPIGAGSAMTAPTTMITGLTDTSSGHYAFASPITEYCRQTTEGTPCSASAGVTTGGTDYIFFSVDRLATATAHCGTATGDGCVLGYSINTPTSAPTNTGSLQVTAVGTPGCWSTSAFVIDNSSASTGASNLYFINMAGNSPSTTPSTCTSGTGHTIEAEQVTQSAIN